MIKVKSLTPNVYDMTAIVETDEYTDLKFSVDGREIRHIYCAEDETLETYVEDHMDQIRDAIEFAVIERGGETRIGFRQEEE